MTIIAIVSQKGGSGKTTLSVNLAAAAEGAGAVALIIDTDPQATASQWGSWRADKAPEVIDSAPPRIQAKVDAAKQQGATVIVIDTPPHADSAASRAVEVADLVLVPCRPSAFDLAAIKTTVSLVRLFDKPAFVVFTAGPPHAPRSTRRPLNWSRASGSRLARKSYLTAPSIATPVPQGLGDRVRALWQGSLRDRSSSRVDCRTCEHVHHRT
jgi:cellulose biosynthesis protein BcsQ